MRWASSSPLESLRGNFPLNFPFPLLRKREEKRKREERRKNRRKGKREAGKKGEMGKLKIKVGKVWKWVEDLLSLFFVLFCFCFCLFFFFACHFLKPMKMKFVWVYQKWKFIMEENFLNSPTFDCTPGYAPWHVELLFSLLRSRRYCV